MFSDLFDTINMAYFFLSVMLFFSGMYIAPTVVEKEISLLLGYPRWLLRLTERFFREDLHFTVVFLMIFTLNNVSLLGSFVSGALIVPPPLAAFFTGFNVAVVTFDMFGWKGIWQILLNPVAWLEFPAAWLSFTLSFELAEAQLQQFSVANAWGVLENLSPLYLKYVATLLLAAAVLETAMIMVGRQLPDDDEEEE